MTKLPNTDDDTNVFFELEEDYSVVHYENIKLLTFSEWISFIGAGLISAIYLIIIGVIHVLIFWVICFQRLHLLIFILELLLKLFIFGFLYIL